MYYKIVYSDIKGKPASHLPCYWSTNFRVWKRAIQQAKRLHKQNRDIVIIEQGTKIPSTWTVNHYEKFEDRFYLV